MRTSLWNVPLFVQGKGKDLLLCFQLVNFSLVILNTALLNLGVELKDPATMSAVVSVIKCLPREKCEQEVVSGQKQLAHLWGGSPPSAFPQFMFLMT